jgi:hypothetical protein
MIVQVVVQDVGIELIQISAKVMEAHLHDLFYYLPRMTEIKSPKTPNTAKPMIMNPIGNPPARLMGGAWVYVGICTGGGAVKVGIRVGPISTTS